MKAIELYTKIMEAINSYDKLNYAEIIGVLEVCKHDVLSGMIKESKNEEKT